jgi:[FeFe] hydrogenase (group B1/B3)
MRGLYTSKTKIRHQIYTEIARLAFEGGEARKIDELPYKIIPGELATYRESIFLERAIVGERLRVAMGMGLRKVSEHAPISQGVDYADIDEKYYEPPLIDIIKFACNSCPEKKTIVTNGCQGCFEHPCTEVCPKGAIKYTIGSVSVIDEEKCINCGRCVKICPFDAIIQLIRPCKLACGVDAIVSDEHGRAKIDHEKCVSCGMCLVSCPFSAIVDKAQIYQTIIALKDKKTDVYAIVAPAIAGQFDGLDNNKMRSAFKALGFKDVEEVAVGADLCTIQEAKDFLTKVPEKLDFLGTSCCPSWSVMAKQLFPKHKDNISMALTPMVLTARLIKQKHPESKIVFIGPCASKKLEAGRTSVRSYVDFVLTFEELAGMFAAKDIDFASLSDDEPLFSASSDGRGFAVSGGVAQAVVKAIRRVHPDMEVKVASAEGLAECKKMLTLAVNGKYDGYLLEGMACPGGCVAGAGTVASPNKSKAALKKMMQEAPFEECIDTKYESNLVDLENFDL